MERDSGVSIASRISCVSRKNARMHLTEQNTPPRKTRSNAGGTPNISKALLSGYRWTPQRQRAGEVRWTAAIRGPVVGWAPDRSPSGGTDTLGGRSRRGRSGYFNPQTRNSILRPRRCTHRKTGKGQNILVSPDHLFGPHRLRVDDLEGRPRRSRTKLHFC